MKRINIFKDYSFWFLLFSNLVVIFFAVKNNENVLDLMWIYWFQSLVIGFFNFIRILNLKKFSTESFALGFKPVEPTKQNKRFAAFFFLFHYNLFHFMYFWFLYENTFNKAIILKDFNETQIISTSFIVFSSLMFLLNHSFSYIYNKPKDTKKQNIGALLFYPYVRIIPKQHKHEA